MLPYPNAHAKIGDQISEVKSLGNEFGFGIIGNVFEVLQSELVRFTFHSLSCKILKIPEFNLRMRQLNNSISILNFKAPTFSFQKPFKHHFIRKQSRILKKWFRRNLSVTLDQKMIFPCIQDLEKSSKFNLSTIFRITVKIKSPLLF